MPRRHCCWALNEEISRSRRRNLGEAQMVPPEKHSLHEIAIAAHDRHLEYVLARINHGGPYSDLRLAGEILC